MKRLSTNLLYSLILLSFCVPASIFAQSGQYTLKDSTNLRDKDRMRQWSYENNLTSFPPAKKSNWSLGLQGGASYIIGDVRAEMGGAFGANVRIPLGNVLSLRTQFTMGSAKGLNWRPNQGIDKNPAWNGINNPGQSYVGDAVGHVFYNFRMKYMEANVQAVFHLNNINFHRKEPKVGIYGFLGLGGMAYETSVNALNASGTKYDYSGVTLTQDYGTRKEVLDQLHSLMDDTYETAGEAHTNKPSMGSRTLVGTAIVGGGLSYKLSRRIDISLEHRVLYAADDLLDGHRWSERLDLTNSYDLHQLTSIGINFRIGKGADSPWWRNPLQASYDQIRELRAFHQKDSKDSDNDGVMDSRDKEPNTPPGATVDVFGRAIDSDGDGIQDFRDNEPFSPKGAQVDRSGVALDADNDGVPDIYDEEANTAPDAFVDARGRAISGGTGGDVNMTAEDADLLLPMINFDLAKWNIKQEFYPNLYFIARLMRQHEEIKMKVIGHADSRGTSPSNKELSRKRAEAVVDFLSRNFSIPQERFQVEFQGEDQPLVSPGEGKGASEGFYYLNRRVEFDIIW